jgi:ATP-dependent Zn protease
MPGEGVDHTPAANATLEIMEQVVEYMGGRAAESLVLRGRLSPAVDDFRQARELAAIICTSPKSIDRFLKFCEQQAKDLLRPHIDLIFALIPELRDRREMSGAEVDEVIAAILTRFALPIEKARRRDLARRAENARSFEAAHVTSHKTEPS